MVCGHAAASGRSGKGRGVARGSDELKAEVWLISQSKPGTGVRHHASWYNTRCASKPQEASEAVLGIAFDSYGVVRSGYGILWT